MITQRRPMSIGLFCFVSIALVFTLFLAACGKDEKKTTVQAQACQYNHVWVESHGCLQQCMNRPGFGWDPTSGACLQGQVTSCDIGYIWVPEYGTCFEQCPGQPGYAWIRQENRCVPGFPGGVNQTF